MNPPAEPPLAIVPDPAEVHRRLGEVLREERILRRQLRLSLAAAEEERRRRDNARAEQAAADPEGTAHA
jgi:hypothetical protein